MHAHRPIVANSLTDRRERSITRPEMTLRSTGSAMRDTPVPATELPVQAQRLLAADDLEGYRELFARLEAIEDPHRRHWAALQLIERGLAAGARAPAALAPALNVALAACVLELLEREPREPRLLNYAGVVLAELWSADAAEALFEAAGRLDPQRRATAAVAGLQGPGAAARCAARARPPRARARGARPAGDGADAEPVHDRPQRGADAAALPVIGCRRGR
jgi:hypothetical protein